jgi:hypothetical protein
MKRKDHLVCLKGNTAGFSVVHCNSEFKPHKHYRCIELSEGNIKEYLVFGVVFSEKEFNERFEYVLDRAKRHFEFLGLTVNGKPISKSKFKALADLHTFKGHGTKYYVHYFQGFDKDKIMYGFHPYFNKDTKVNSLNNAYRMFIDFLNGVSEEFDEGQIEFGNCGTPLVYGRIGQRYVELTNKTIL